MSGPPPRRFTAARKVRMGDVDPSGRLRLDAAARYFQDVANDDAADAGEGEFSPWVVRRIAIEVEAWPRLGDAVELATWCSGTGPRWAERTTTLGGITSRSLWVYVDRKTLMPARLPDRFFEIWGAGERVRGRLSHADPPADSPVEGDGAVSWQPWPLRAVDFDVLDHVNNAVYWEAVEEVFGGLDLRGAEVEYRTPITRGSAVLLGVLGDAAWLRGEDGAVFATVQVQRR